MTLTIAVSSPDGVVLAADSRTTTGGNPTRVLSDFTHKVFEVNGMAVSTYGWAFLCRRNIASHVAAYAIADGLPSEPEPLAQALAAHFKSLVAEHIAQGFDTAPPADVDVLGFLVAGMEGSEPAVYEVLLPSGKVVPAVKGPGAAWRGQTDVVVRLLKGVDLALLDALGASDPDVAAKRSAFQPTLDLLEYMVPFQILNLQDAVDFAVFAIRTTIDAQRLTNGTAAKLGAWPGVGGPIEIAVVEPLLGFRWLQRTEVLGERPSGRALDG